MTGIIGALSLDLQRKQESYLKSMDFFAKNSKKKDNFKTKESQNCILGQQGFNLLDAENKCVRPVSSSDGKHTVVFDGEIYNQEEIKQLLRKENYSTDFSSTEELVLQSFLCWNTDCVRYFNGEFSFAVFNEFEEELYLFRDKIGIKPLYFSDRQDGFYFSTEIEALLPFIQPEKWSAPAIHYYFRVGYIPAPLTIYEQIKKLEEGAFLKVSTKHLFPIIEKYWSPEEKIEKTPLNNEVDARKQLKDLLISAIDLRMNTPHAFGTLLSGGIDSSTVTAIAQSLSDKPISTFSIEFQEASHGDSHYAKEVAKKLGTQHTAFNLSAKEAQELLPEIPNWYGQPYADSSAIPTFLVAQKASQNVQMVFSGDGGDEQFMGYGMYKWATRLEAFKNSRNFYKILLQLSPKINHKRVAQYFDFSADEIVPMHIFSVDQGFFSAKQIRSHFHFKENITPFSLLPTKRKLSVSEKQALYDLKYYMPGDLTVKVDRTMLQNGITSRAPLLDHRIIEWSLNLDERLKVKGDVTKYLLKQVLFEYLPPYMFNRPKWGFGIPLANWLNADLKFLLEEYVSPEVLKQFPFYNVSSILEMKKQFLAGKTYLYNKLWLIIVFNMWAKNKKRTF